MILPISSNNIPAVFRKIAPEYKRAIYSFVARLPSKGSQVQYGKDLFQFFDWGGISDFKNYTREHIFAYRHKLESHGYATATISRKISVVRSFFQWLVECELVEKDPSRLCKPPAPDSLYGKTPTLAGDGLQKLLAATSPHTQSGMQQRLIIELLFYCGIRCSELLGIRVKDITQEDGYTVLEVLGKGNLKRRIPLQPFLVQAIERYKQGSGLDLADGKAFLFQPFHNPRGKQGQHLSDGYVRQMLRRLARKAGIKTRVSPHVGRASCAAQAIERNCTEESILALFGWKSRQTVDLYCRRKLSLKHNAANFISYR